MKKTPRSKKTINPPEPGGAARHAVGIAAITFAVLALFATKAFQTDDVLFLDAAAQILRDPLRPYDLSIIWYESRQLMWDANMNPPLNAYLIAGWAKLFGFGEVPLHLFYGFLAALSIAVTYLLAKRFVERPWVATLFVASSPAFLVSATNVMSDIPFFLFFTGAILFFLRGMDDRRWISLCASGVLMGLAFLTKYVGIVLLPLLIVYYWTREKRLDRRLLVFVIPILIALPWLWASISQHGQNHFLQATRFVADPRLTWAGRLTEYLPIGLIYLGAGTLFIPLSLAFPLWSKRRLAWGILLAVLVVLPWVMPDRLSRVWSWGLVLGLGAVLSIGRIIKSLDQEFSPDWLLLSLWGVGIFVFMVGYNWTVAERTVLLMVAPFAIEVTRTINRLPVERLKRILPICIIGISLTCSITLAAADYMQADAYRRFPREVAERIDAPPENIHFLGNGGFLYYMRDKGYQPIDNHVFRPRPGNYIVLGQVSLVRQIPPGLRRVIEEETPNRLCLATSNRIANAGFYSSFFADYPFTISCEPYEIFQVFQIR